MRWQQSFFSSPCDDARQSIAARRSLVLLLGGCFLAAATFLVARAAGPAQAQEITEADNATSTSAGDESGMSASNPRVKSLLSQYPGDFVTVCVAGCDGKPAIVQILPKPSARRLGTMRPTSGQSTGADGGKWHGRPAYGAPSDATADAVVCAAGCGGAPGRIVQRLALPPSPGPRAPSEPARTNEPLEVR